MRGPGTYPGSEFASEWVCVESSSSLSVATVNNGTVNDPFVGSRQMYGLYNPIDTNAYFKGQPVYGRSYYAGSMPPSIAAHQNVSHALGDTKTNGTEIYTCMSNVLWVQTAA